MRKNSAQVTFDAEESADLLLLLGTVDSHTEKYYVLPAMERLMMAINDGKTVIFTAPKAADADH